MLIMKFMRGKALHGIDSFLGNYSKVTGYFIMTDSKRSEWILKDFKTANVRITLTATIVGDPTELHLQRLRDL